MPNHITNILDVTGPAHAIKAFMFIVGPDNPALKTYWKEVIERQILQCKEQIKADPNNMRAIHNLRELESQQSETKTIALDFNSTVCMPHEIRCTTSGSGLSEAETKQQAENEKKYGAKDWYEWSRLQWGTKWGAYDVEEPEMLPNGVRFRFNTAWCCPNTWLEKTAPQFSELRFEDSWRDEGGGAGIYVLYMKEGDLETENADFTDHDWKMQWDENYKEQYEEITKGNYPTFLKNVLAGNEDTYDSDLHVEIVKRIKNKDLPLFINWEWYTDAATELFTERLKTAKIPSKKKAIKINLLVVGDYNPTISYRKG